MMRRPRRGDRMGPREGDPRRRREDALQDLIEHGSRNFRAYRRWTTLVLVMVTLVSTYSLKASSDARQDSIDAICLVDTQQNRTLRRMIVDGTKGSRVFEPLYKRHGAPPYRERLEQAYTQAARLPDVDCEALHEGRPPE
jgi:hypothetical protein